MDRHSSSALVFISYSSANRPVAEAACESLETKGIRCWIAPRNVDPGVPYAGQIIHKQFDFGIADCTEAITLNPNLALAYLNRAFGYQQVGEIQKAKADRAKGEQLKAGNPGLDRPAGR